MRVLTVGNMYPPHHLGGYELMWRSWVQHMRRAGHEVRVLTTDFRAHAEDPDDPDVHRELRWYWADHAFPSKGLLERLRLERHNAGVLERNLAEVEPEVVCWWAMGGMSMSLLERVRRARIPAASVVVDDWLIYGPQQDQWMRLIANHPLVGSVAGRLAGLPREVDYDSAADWLFASASLRHWAAVDGGHAVDDAEVIHPGIDTDLFAGPSQPDREWSGRLLYCGRIEGRKGIDVAIEALPLMPEARLTVVGPGDERLLGELRKLAGQLGVTDRVEFTRRPREELPGVYEAADATLFPVRWEEPFGLVPLESMAMGTPVVASGRGGSGEYLRDGENCVLFDVDEGVSALADAVGRLASDAELRARVRGGGLETAREHPAERFERRVEERVLEAASRRPRPAGS